MEPTRRKTQYLLVSKYAGEIIMTSVSAYCVESAVEEAKAQWLEQSILSPTLVYVGPGRFGNNMIGELIYGRDKDDAEEDAALTEPHNLGI